MTSNLKPACLTGDERVLYLTRRLAREAGEKAQHGTIFMLAGFARRAVRACYGSRKGFSTRLGQAWMALQLLREGEEAAELERIGDVTDPRAQALLATVTGTERNQIAKLERLAVAVGLFVVEHHQKGNRRVLKPTPALLEAMRRDVPEPSRGPESRMDRHATVARIGMAPEGLNQETNNLPTGGATPSQGGENRLRRVLEAAQEPVLASAEPNRPRQARASLPSSQEPSWGLPTTHGGGGGQTPDRTVPAPKSSRSGASGPRQDPAPGNPWNELMGRIRTLLPLIGLAGERAPEGHRLTMTAKEARAVGQVSGTGKAKPDIVALASSLHSYATERDVRPSGLPVFEAQVIQRLSAAGEELRSAPPDRFVGSWLKPVLHYVRHGYLPDAAKAAGKGRKPSSRAIAFARIVLEELGGGEHGDQTKVARSHDASWVAWKDAHPNEPATGFDLVEEEWTEALDGLAGCDNPVSALLGRMRDSRDEWIQESER